MNFYSGDSFNQIYFQMLSDAYYSNINLTPSRNGNVKDLGRSIYQIENDKFRLCFLKERRINPFFAFAEFSWIISGSNKLEDLQYFISSYNEFSDDGLTLNGAYGYRLKKYFNNDQIEQAINLLRQDQNTRRVVLTMYSPEDLFKSSKDIPCNTTIYLKIRNNKLDITILNRSNDLYLGVPYNVFVFYLLQVYISYYVGCEIGVQTHYTDSLHLYETHIEKVKDIVINNSLEKIKSFEENIEIDDNSQYALIDHSNVLNKNYELIKNSIYKNIFLLHKTIKFGNGNIDYDTIPKSLLGHVVSNWLNNKTTRMLEKEDRVMTNLQILETLKYKNVSEFIELLVMIKEDNINKFEEFKALVSIDNDSNSILNYNDSDKGKFITIMLLVLVLESISSNMYNRDLRDEMMNKIKEVCLILNISINDIFYFSKYMNQISALIR